jgi:hypothetical protein
MKQDLPKMEDYFAITHMFARYAWMMDTRDIAGLATVFTEDAEVEVGRTGKRYYGFKEIAGYYDGLHNIPAFKGRQHHLDNLLIEGSGDRYVGKAYWFITGAQPAEGTQLPLNGHYDDIYVRQSGFWRIKSRIIHIGI